MTSSGPDGLEPLLGKGTRLSTVAVGGVALLAGGVAVFATDNELGSTALVTAGVALFGLAVFGNRIKAVEAMGVRLELERQALEARVEARQARAAGQVERAEELEQRADHLLSAAGDVGLRYEHVRRTEPSSWDRTSRMESILLDARALDSSALSVKDVEGIFATGTEGNRIVAIALIESDPRLATATVLTDAIVHSRSAFEQFHALSAAERALASLPTEDRSTVLQAVESVLDGRLGEGTSDRRTVARRILERSRR